MVQDVCIVIDIFLWGAQELVVEHLCPNREVTVLILIGDYMLCP